MIVTVATTVVASCGIRSARFFLVPAAYLAILFGGYQQESSLPTLIGLEIWEAGLMAAFMNTVGMNIKVSGNIVTLANSAGFLSLGVASACTCVSRASWHSACRHRLPSLTQR
jgi:hypothetical protein